VLHILDGILSKSNGALEQGKCAKRELRAQSSLPVICFTQGPSKPMAACIPSLAKLHALKHLISKVMAI
jgi:ribosomal protein L25 (general stress protein Ctc)